MMKYPQMRKGDDDMEQMTPKQQKFIDYYIQTGNATEAAKLAGYSKRTAYSIGNENLNKPEIKQAIDERLKQLESERIAESTEIMESLTAVIRGQAVEEVILQVKGKVQRLTRQTSTRDKLRAIELLAKMKGWFIDKKELKFKGKPPVVIIDDIRPDNDEEYGTVIHHGKT